VRHVWFLLRTEAAVDHMDAAAAVAQILASDACSLTDLHLLYEFFTRYSGVSWQGRLPGSAQP
jgi:hypothetical protein